MNRLVFLGILVVVVLYVFMNKTKEKMTSVPLPIVDINANDIKTNIQNICNSTQFSYKNNTYEGLEGYLSKDGKECLTIKQNLPFDISAIPESIMEQLRIAPKNKEYICNDLKDRINKTPQEENIYTKLCNNPTST